MNIIKVLIEFNISSKESIQIFIPENKINWYYKPTKKLNKFDEVQVVYQTNDFKIIFS